MTRSIVLVAMLGLCSSVLAASAVNAPLPKSVSDFRWDLPSLYPDQASSDADRASVLSALDQLAATRGRAARNAASLADVLDLLRAVRARAGKMARFAVLSVEIDQRSTLARSRYDAATALEA